MSKGKTLAGIISGLFGKSEKAISEKLSSEEYASFTEDASDLNTKLEAQTTLNETLSAQVTELNGKLEAATKFNESTAAQLTEMTGERDKYKAHYDAAAKSGSDKAKEDENSRNKVEVASYNANALEVWSKVHGGGK